jgi:hypothetical protein
VKNIALLENHIRIGAGNGYSRDEIREYKLYIDLAAIRDAEVFKTKENT